jgi:hypothetical protein
MGLLLLLLLLVLLLPPRRRADRIELHWRRREEDE